MRKRLQDCPTETEARRARASIRRDEYEDGNDGTQSPMMIQDMTVTEIAKAMTTRRDEDEDADDGTNSKTNHKMQRRRTKYDHGERTLTDIVNIMARRRRDETKTKMGTMGRNHEGEGEDGG